MTNQASYPPINSKLACTPPEYCVAPPEIAPPFQPELDLVTTVDNSRVHISVENHYMGSIKLKTSFLCGRGTKLIIGPDLFHVTKDSLKDHMVQYHVSSGEIGNHYEKMIISAVTANRVAFRTARMFEHLSESKRDELLGEYIDAVQRKDFLHAITLVKKGAPLGYIYHGDDMVTDRAFSLDPYRKYSRKFYYSKTIYVNRATLYTLAKAQKVQAVKAKEEKARLLELLSNEFSCDNQEAQIAIKCYNYKIVSEVVSLI